MEGSFDLGWMIGKVFQTPPHWCRRVRFSPRYHSPPMATPCQKKQWKRRKSLALKIRVSAFESMKEEESVHRPSSIIESEVSPPLLVAWTSRMLIGQWMITNSA